MKRSIPVLLVSALALSTASAQTSSSDIQKLIKESKTDSHALDILHTLTKGIGHRLTASPNLDKAYAWTVREFEKYGCTNVHLEEWSEWPLAFHRGPSTGRMIYPTTMDFEFTTPSWMVGTDGPQRAEIIMAPKTKAEFEKVKGQLKDHWLVYDEPIPRAPRGRRGEEPPEPSDELKARLEVEELLNKTPMLGRVVPSRNELVLTGGSYQSKNENLTITIRKSDMEKVISDHKAGKPVVLEFNLDHQFKEGPIKNYNVVAEIRGTEKPDEVVILGGHLDSWDGPGSEGAADNANGIAVTMEAARLLCKLGIKPKRTIRFILFTGEEQGLHGSRAYVEQHKDEMDKISAIFIEDGGANYEGGAVGLKSMEPMFKPVFDVMNKAFPDMPMSMRIVEQMPRGGGSDHVPFNAVGVPGFFWNEVGTFDYNFVHHTQHDYFERVPEPYLIQSATCSAVTMLMMANAPTLMPRQPQPTADGGN